MLVIYQSANKTNVDISKKKKWITFVGKLNRAKGYDIFGKAVIKLLNNHNNWRAIVVGDEQRDKIYFCFGYALHWLFCGPLVKSALRLAPCDLPQNVKCDLFPGKRSQNYFATHLRPFSGKKLAKYPIATSTPPPPPDPSYLF